MTSFLFFRIQNVANQGARHANHTRGSEVEFAQDPLSLPSGPITRLRAKRFQENH
jgi:hypothetical protein